jgi:hypothetical protein
MKKQRNHHTPEEKVAILTRFLRRSSAAPAVSKGSLPHQPGFRMCGLRGTVNRSRSM